jgi:hypothetical protein
VKTRPGKHILAKPITTAFQEGMTPFGNALIKERITHRGNTDYPPVTYELTFDLGDKLPQASTEWLRRSDIWLRMPSEMRAKLIKTCNNW